VFDDRSPRVAIIEHHSCDEMFDVRSPRVATIEHNSNDGNDGDDVGKRVCVIFQPRLVCSDLVLAPSACDRRLGIVKHSSAQVEAPVTMFSSLRFSDPTRSAKLKNLSISHAPIICIRDYRPSSCTDR
jgi:hypothetical protein